MPHVSNAECCWVPWDSRKQLWSEVRTLGMHGRACVKGTGLKNAHDGFPSPFLLWTSAAAASAPEEPFAFAVTKVLHSKREPWVLIKAAHFLQPTGLPTRYKLTTVKHFSALIEKFPPGARPPGTHTVRYLLDDYTQACRNEGRKICIQAR